MCVTAKGEAMEGEGNRRIYRRDLPDELAVEERISIGKISKQRKARRSKVVLCGGSGEETKMMITNNNSSSRPQSSKDAGALNPTDLPGAQGGKGTASGILSEIERVLGSWWWG